jgi:cell division initiation protein
MVLRSLDISDKVFESKVAGYDMREVDDFLDVVIRDYDEFLSRIRTLRRENKQLNDKITYYEGQKEALNHSIIVSQIASDGLKAEACNTAEEMILDAEEKAASIIASAKVEAETAIDKMTDEVSTLIRQTDEIKARMRAIRQRMLLMSETQLALMTDEEWDDIFSSSTSEDKR